METTGNWKVKTHISRILLGLMLAISAGSMYATPSFADNDKGHGNKHDNGRYEKRGRGNDHDRYEKRGHGNHRDRYYRNRRYYRPYGYRERVYVDPPVVYAPPSPPGISIFFPPLFFNL